MKGRWESYINIWFPFISYQKWKCYFQNRIIMFCVPVSTLISLWEIYIFAGSVCLFCGREISWRSWKYINRSQTYECGNWDWGRAIPWKGIHRWDFPCSVDYLAGVLPVHGVDGGSRVHVHEVVVGVAHHPPAPVMELHSCIQYIIWNYKIGSGDNFETQHANRFICFTQCRILYHDLITVSLTSSEEKSTVTMVKTLKFRKNRTALQNLNSTAKWQVIRILIATKKFWTAYFFKLCLSLVYLLTFRNISFFFKFVVTLLHELFLKLLIKMLYVCIKTAMINLKIMLATNRIPHNVDTVVQLHRKKKFSSFPSLAGMSLTNSPWAGIMTS